MLRSCDNRSGKGELVGPPLLCQLTPFPPPYSVTETPVVGVPRFSGHTALSHASSLIPLISCELASIIVVSHNH